MKNASKAFHRLAAVAVVTTILLVWWGAAVTTTQAGMAFADWPLSAGSINPEGWLKILPYFLEHGHRLIATLVGFLTLGLFAWSFVRSGANLAEFLAVVAWLAGIVALMTIAGSEREDASRKVTFWWAAGAAGAVVFAWLGWSWRSRGWPLLTRLSALALVVVVAQAILGGMRVTEVSDLKAVLHACLAQAFFCLLLLIAWLSAGRRQKELTAAESSTEVGSWLKAAPLLLAGAVYVQLILGAMMRHFHRAGLADTGIVTTRGALIPPFDEPIIVVMFLHKYWALAILALGVAAAVVARRHLASGDALRRLLMLVAVLLVAQLTLGIAVIVTGKSFWITNFHVLNGLAILALSFLGAVRTLGIGRSPMALCYGNGAGAGVPATTALPEGAS